ncbi:MAG TPA: DUF222 domain-containing protein [Propionibacteriaceae bacterium]|nr:DUF222 domain-containing protein [Propionibacteriaceae bacterium]
MEVGDPTAAERIKRSRLDVALTTFDAALDGLINTVEAGGLDHLSAAEKISFWQRFETSRNRLPLIDHALIADAEATDLAGEYCFSNLKMLLTRTLQLSPTEAAARVRAAVALAPRVSTEGEAEAPVLPHLAAAQRAGEVSTEQVQIVTRAMQKLSRPDLDPDEVTAAEQQLAKQAQLHGPKDLQQIAARVVDAVDPDGPDQVDDQLQQDRRHVELKQRRDGMWQLEGKLTNTVGAQLHAILDPLTRPRTSTVVIDGKTVELPDERHYGQRVHDAFEDACGRLLQLADRPAVGGTPASVIVTVQVEDLLAKADIAETTDGSTLSADQLLRIADQAEIWPTIINRNGVPLALGRTRRIATRGQTMALIAREGGCSFPGCDHPPQWCDRHHIIDWIDGGPTDLNNMTLLCRYHHTHFLQKGWSCRINDDRLPEWVPPRWIDPQQRPQLNSRIRRLQAQRELSRRRRTPAAA